MKPTIPDVVPLMQAVYARHPSGCCAHLVLDDGNVADADVEFCLEQARQRNHADCVGLCEALAATTKTQRAKLSRIGRGP